jgi:hypothetical protein
MSKTSADDEEEATPSSSTEILAADHESNRRATEGKLSKNNSKYLCTNYLMRR